MDPALIDAFGRLRLCVRRFTIAASASVAAALVLVPSVWRTGIPEIERWLLAGFTVLYLGMTITRVLAGFFADRQIDLEERLVVQAAGSGGLLAAVRARGKVARPSTIVQSLARVLAADTDPADVERRGFLLLRSGLVPLRPSAMRLPPILLVATGALWTWSVSGLPSLRGMAVYAVVVPALAVLAICEGWMMVQSSRSGAPTETIARLLAEALGREADRNDADFTHRILYRDRADEHGLPT